MRVRNGQRPLYARHVDRSAEPINAEGRPARHPAPHVDGGVVLLVGRQGIGVLGVGATLRNRDALHDRLPGLTGVPTAAAHEREVRGRLLRPRQPDRAAQSLHDQGPVAGGHGPGHRVDHLHGAKPQHPVLRPCDLRLLTALAPPSEHRESEHSEYGECRRRPPHGTYLSLERLSAKKTRGPSEARCFG